MSAQNIENLELCTNLAQAESEKEVIKILTKAGFWQNTECWNNYGGKENNYSIVGNQQSKPDAAFVEKVVNSTDAILIEKCLASGIDPESSKAPNSITDALTQYFEFPEGSLSRVDSNTRAKLAIEYIGIVATGKRNTPCLTVFDRGCGQTPSNFKNTFLSLAESNKIKINFVQGKFNMGSTGALPFCGEQSLQLIISKRNPSLDDTASDAEKWGFTIIRKEPPTGQMRSSRITYLAPNANILTVEAATLSILPGKYPDPYSEKMGFGSYVKMYDYDIGPGLKAPINLDLYNRLSLLMPSMPLPARMYERRSGYKANSYESTLAGLTTRVVEDKRDNLEPNFPASATFTLFDHTIKVKILAFKKGQGENKKEKYSKKDGVVFSLNGQAQGFISDAFFNRKKVGMGYLKESLLILVDCSEINNDMKERLFMNSRDRLRDGTAKDITIENLQKIISTHQGLKDLRAERKQQAINDNLADDKPLADILNDIIKDSPALSQLLLNGQRISDPFKTKKVSGKKEFIGKQFPTFFTPSKESTPENRRKCEQTRDTRLKFSTDVENDYFDRSKIPGKLTVISEKFGNLRPSQNLWNGTANISITFPKEAKVGDVDTITFEVSDGSRPIPLISKMHIEIIAFGYKTKTEEKKKKKENPDEHEGEDATTQNHLSLPTVTPVHKNDWDKYNFDANDALAVLSDGVSYDFFYNADNIHLKSTLKVSKDEEAGLIEMQYKTALVLLGMSILKHNTQKSDKNEDTDVEAIVKETAKVISPTILPMIRGLGSISEGD